MGKGVQLTAEEAKIVGDLLNEYGGEYGRTGSGDSKGRLWRLVVKIDKATTERGRWSMLQDGIPEWAVPLIHQTFAPDQAPAVKKKPAAAKVAPKAAARPAGGAAPGGKSGKTPPTGRGPRSSGTGAGSKAAAAAGRDLERGGLE